MRNMDNLGDYDGGVDFFGLDEFGVPAGLNPTWGVVAGGAVSTGTAIAVRALTAQDKYAEGIGAGVGTIAGTIMMLFRGSRGAGLAAIATSLATAGLRQLEALLSPMEAQKQDQAAAQKEGTQPTQGYGLPVVQPAMIPGQWNGVTVQPLGIATVEPAMMPGQMNGLGQMPQLLGQGQGQMPNLVGAGLSGHFGATVFGSR